MCRQRRGSGSGAKLARGDQAVQSQENSPRVFWAQFGTKMAFNGDQRRPERKPNLCGRAVNAGASMGPRGQKENARKPDGSRSANEPLQV